MYKFLLAWRYLRTRYIALASIVSVTLGVATLVIVNSVMSGFTNEMKIRLHGILSDIEVASPGLGELYDPEWHMDEVRKVVGDDLEGITAVVRVPAMLMFKYGRRQITQQVLLLGVDEETYSKVSDFDPFLMNELNRSNPGFELRSEGYAEELPFCGWPYRKQEVEARRLREEWLRKMEADAIRAAKTAGGDSLAAAAPVSGQPENTEGGTSKAVRGEIAFRPLPAVAPSVPEFELVDREDTEAQREALNPDKLGPLNPAPESENRDSLLSGSDQAVAVQDPFAGRYKDDPAYQFDPATQQYSGIILGVALANRKYKNPETGKTEDLYMCLPGDDVQLMLPSVGDVPRPVYAVSTISDFYQSGMHEYDSSFAFMPLKELQKLRGMIGVNRAASVSSIQIKLKPDADLEKIRDKLIAHFPPHLYPYQIQTWKDTQRPLLAAVSLEITILNILLFLIIAVAGFGILATFFMIVVEKTKDIGILKSLGAPSQGVMSIFLSYGLSLGIVGSGVGILIGVLFVIYINDIADLVEVVSGRKVFDETVYYFSEIPTILNPFTIAYVAIGAVLIAVSASVLPALRAARLHPVEALRA